MRSPTFSEIWNDTDWVNYSVAFQPRRTRKFLKFRSVCRMAIWIPYSVALVYLMLTLVSVYS
jgi:gamma-glutamylcysteine synthetase